VKKLPRHILMIRSLLQINNESPDTHEAVHLWHKCRATSVTGGQRLMTDARASRFVYNVAKCPGSHPKQSAADQRSPTPGLAVYNSSTLKTKDTPDRLWPHGVGKYIFVIY
jgi:hypothetical protein